MQNMQNPQDKQNVKDRPTDDSKFGPFFNSDGSLVLDWVGDKARKKAEEFSKVLHNNKSMLSSTGLRNFYNEFLRIKELPEGYDEEKKILIRLLVPKVEYKKNNKTVPKIFAQFINELVNEIGDSIERFEKACLIMEALVGFYTETRKDKNR